MKGCKPLDQAELRLTLQSFDQTYSTRDRAIFVLGITTGLRVSELSSLKLKDVLDSSGLLPRIYLPKKCSKGGSSGACLLLTQEAKLALSAWLKELPGPLLADTYLFKSRKGFNRPLGRKGIYDVIKKAMNQAGVQGKTGVHSLRKSFAKGIYEGSGFDIIATQKALRHVDLSSTASYLSFSTDNLDTLITKVFSGIGINEAHSNAETTTRLKVA